jgi:glycosidase
MSVPAWVQDAIFYQIFPDRFANGDPGNDPVNVHAWGAEPTIWDFQGGDLQGVLDHLDYLSDMGVNALYFNPIFLSTSNHRYNTSDYYTIDPKLGSMEVFRNLLEQVHRRGIRMILDGVFNHCGRGFFAFNDVMENQKHSAYQDWFHIKQFPLEAYTPGDAENFLGWWKFKSLPKFNTDNPQVRDYIYGVARYWINEGIDGWRLDVPSEIDDDDFWAGFRDVVKSANPEAYLLGEIWKVEPRWVGPNHFDGLMNYPMRDALVDLIENNSITPEGFIEEIESLLGAYDRENTFAHFVPLGSHDTPRIATILGGDFRKVKLFYSILYCYPGAPALYYGDEIGLEGGEDPGCRKAFLWDESQWNNDLRGHIKQLIQIRHQYEELRRGDLFFVPCEPGGVIGIGRRGERASCVLVFNSTDKSKDVRLPVSSLGWAESQVVQELLMQEQHIVSEGKLGLHLTPFQALLLRGEG